MMSQTITEEQFAEMMLDLLGPLYDRALVLFKACGASLAWDITNVLIHAADQGKTDKVLSLLEEHNREHLQLQHPEIRGHVPGEFGVNPTKALLLHICTDVLELEPNPA